MGVLAELQVTVFLETDDATSPESNDARAGALRDRLVSLLQDVKADFNIRDNDVALTIRSPGTSEMRIAKSLK
jgi:hypothetical protein